MERIKLRIGGTVFHETLGTGTVISADDSFCTVSFESKEAMFRLPDAFEKGFLKSEDAIILEAPKPDESLADTGSCDTGTKEILAAAETSQESAEQDSERFGEGCAIWVFVIIGGAIMIPCAIHFVKKAFDTGLYYNLWLASIWIIGFIIYSLIVRWIVKRGRPVGNESEQDVDLFTKLMIGIMGSDLLMRKKKDDPDKYW